MEGFSPWHWLIIIFLMLIWSYPLSVLCRRTGKSPGVGWLAGTVGLFVARRFGASGGWR